MRVQYFLCSIIINLFLLGILVFTRLVSYDLDFNQILNDLTFGNFIFFLYLLLILCSLAWQYLTIHSEIQFTILNIILLLLSSFLFVVIIASLISFIFRGGIIEFDNYLIYYSARKIKFLIPLFIIVTTFFFWRKFFRLSKISNFKKIYNRSILIGVMSFITALMFYFVKFIFLKETSSNLFQGLLVLVGFIMPSYFFVMSSMALLKAKLSKQEFKIKKIFIIFSLLGSIGFTLITSFL